MRRASSILGVVQTCQPGGETFHRNLELGERVGELLQTIGNPRQGDFLVTPALFEFLDPAISEIHDGFVSLEGGVEQIPLLLLVSLGHTDGG